MFQEYFNKKLFLIPIIKADKFPLSCATGFNEWALDGYDKDVMQMFSRFEKLGTCGYAILLGPASDLICVDFDTLEEEVINAIPPSPVGVRGDKLRYGKFFYRYSDGVSNTNTKVKIGGIDHGLDVLVQRKYAIIPPSVHKKGYAYEWINPKLTILDVCPSDLPILNESDIERAKRKLIDLSDDRIKFNSSPDYWQTLYPRTDDARRKDAHGAHNQLSKFAHILIANRTPLDEATRKIIEFEDQYHKDIPHLDPRSNHGDAKADRFSNTAKYYSSLLSSTNRDRIRKGLEPEIPYVDELKLPKPNIENRIITKDYPKLTGLMADIESFFLNEAPTPQRTFAVGGSLCVMSVMCGGRFHWERSYPNVLAMFSGGTGSGKDIIRSGATSILMHPKMRKRNLLGLGDYVSAPALAISLPSQRVRLDVIDEFSGFLRNVSFGNQLKRDAALEITKLWSSAGSYYPGIKSIGRGEDTGACYGPYVSLMGFVQAETLISSANKDMLDNGFLPRFLIFNVERRGDLNTDAIFRTPDPTLLVNELIRAFPGEEILEGVNNTKKLNIGDLELTPENLLVENSVKKYLQDIAMQIHDNQNKIKDPVWLAFETRRFEYVMKIMILAAVSNGRRDVSISDVDFANNMVEAIQYNSRFLLSEATASGDYAKLFEKLSSYLHKKGIASEKEIAGRLRGVPLKTRQSVLHDLESHGLIKYNPTKKEWISAAE